MILGAFVLGPLAAYLLKLFDNLVAGKVKAGFEMLIDNFSIGILGGALAIFGYKVIEPVVGWITDRLGEGVEPSSTTACFRCRRSSSSRRRSCSSTTRSTTAC